MDRLSAFFDIIQQDPVISQVKLIAEPWDLGDGGYQVGNFPPLWTEWNGKYRDTVRDFWRGEPASLAEFASRLTGSSDLYAALGPAADRLDQLRRLPTTASPCAIWCPTTRSTTRPTAKTANDGESHNRSWNCGVEGRDRRSRRSTLSRLRQQRNFITTLMVSQGVPMLAHGDELGRTQHGNNNVYAQDNEISWVDWDLDADQKRPAGFHLGGDRRRAGTIRYRAAGGFFAGDARHGGEAELGDIEWFKPDASEMDEADWNSGFARSLMVFLNGDAIPELDAVGRRISDDHFLPLFNAHTEPIRFTMPAAEFGQNWLVRLDSHRTGRSPNVRPWRRGHPPHRRALDDGVVDDRRTGGWERAAAMSRARRASICRQRPCRPSADVN